MKIAILGTRGIPNNYGGFEQFADILSQGLVQKGHEVTVYCSGSHLYKSHLYNGVQLIHKYDPENRIGTIGQFIYDFLCILDARKRDFDFVYMLGYGSSSIWQGIFCKSKPFVITNMDGLEWKRNKYSKKVKLFLRFAEKLAVRNSSYLIADSKGIQTYLKNTYNVKSTYLPYGSFIFIDANQDEIKTFDVQVYEYDMLVARFEPENNIEMILQAYVQSITHRQLLLVGNYKHNKFGLRMFNQYNNVDKRIRFIGAIYDQRTLNNLRYFSNLYFHGHSVGGTNPSLLEAMGSSALICYHDNEFNRAIVNEDGFAFSDSKTLTNIINNTMKTQLQHYIEHNLHKIANIYSWKNIIDQYEYFFKGIKDQS
ncbi:DUF1972 domain-containing protein [Microbacter margulisiae]|uniref:Glycosyltransferase involved in cell wall biosynthesis n=1 Tax=Microbacter margulisiae TaxID=1350067 RepID=A0A7W5DRG4_9PORP|nr:DUF1972 domain-containing protein [Microbacter margulisiae]MBB3187194.1 glycosyltransferase involved in cell wall biosynthesis [Microbacter margulisiae]